MSSDEKVLDFPKAEITFAGKGQAGDGRSEAPGQPSARRVEAVDRPQRRTTSAYRVPLWKT